MDEQILKIVKEAGFDQTNPFDKLDPIVRHSNGGWVSVHDRVLDLYELAFIEGLKAAAEVSNTHQIERLLKEKQDARNI